VISFLDELNQPAQPGRQV